MAFEWSADKLAAKTSKEVQQVLENAARVGRNDLVEMCAMLLESRLSAGRSSMTVAEFHFVCAADTGVSVKPDGMFTSGVWVVADVHRKPSLRDAAMVALHSSKIELSYRQGVIVGWEDVPRSEFGDGMGVQFLIRPTSEALPWQGAGSGEKGYLWRERVPKSARQVK